MVDKSLAQITMALDQEDRTLFIKRMRVCLYYMAIPLVLSFSAVDYFFAPKLIGDFVVARLLVIPISITCYQLYKLKWIAWTYYQLPAHLFVIYLGSLNTFLAWQTGAEASPYYAGLNLVGIAAFGFLPWKWHHMLATACLLYGPYFFTAAFKSHLDLALFIPNAAFMVSTIFMAGIVTFLAHQLRFAEISSRVALKNQVEVQEKVIEEKTKEGVYLERLTTQFSPQIVKAIKGGEVSIDKRQRRELTCIFIDVENSTGRSVRLDHYDYTDTLSDFFSGCVDIFLKHDVTVSTYLGDGILAFVNAPQATKDHNWRAIQACLEILEKHSLRKSFYLEKWRTEFTIRIGINTGFASVGFFPNATRGTYTAIGDAVNLAARLCGKAKPDTICVTKGLLRGVGDNLKGVVVEFQETAENIKGFENEQFELFAISPKEFAAEVKLDKCPLCTGNLLVSSDLGKAFLLKCSSCNYSDIVDHDNYVSQKTTAA